MREAEIDRAQQKARAEEATKRARVERDRLRLTIALLTSVLALVVLGCAGAFWIFQQRQNRLKAAEAILARVEMFHQRAEAQGANPVAWREALAAADQALATGGDLPNLAPGVRLAALRQEIAEQGRQADRDRRLMTELADFRSKRYQSDEGYKTAFENFGLHLLHRDVPGDPPATPLDEVFVHLNSLSERSRREVVEYLDDWAIVVIELSLMRGANDYQSQVAQLMAVARGLDPDPERNRLRSLLELPNLDAHREVLIRMAKDSREAGFGASTALLLATALDQIGEKAPAIDVLRSAIVRHPGDFWANFTLARKLSSAGPGRIGEAIRYYSIVRALRPETGGELADLLLSQGQEDEAESIRRELVRSQPAEAQYWTALMDLLKHRGKSAEASKLLEHWIDRLGGANRDAIAHFKIAFACRWAGDRPRELAELKEAIRLDPNLPNVHHQLGHTLLSEHDWAGAIKAYREAIRINSEDLNCHYELAYALCLSGDHPGEIASLREAIRLAPHVKDGGELESEARQTYYVSDDYKVLDMYLDSFEQGPIALGNALAETGDLPGAIGSFNEAIRLADADRTMHFVHFGMTLMHGWREQGAPHCYLGLALLKTGNSEGAIAELREAVRLEPEQGSSDVAFPLCLALAQKGDLPARSRYCGMPSGPDPTACRMRSSCWPRSS